MLYKPWQDPEDTKHPDNLSEVFGGVTEDPPRRLQHSCLDDPLRSSLFDSHPEIDRPSLIEYQKTVVRDKLPVLIDHHFLEGSSDEVEKHTNRTCIAIQIFFICLPGRCRVPVAIVTLPYERNRAAEGVLDIGGDLVYVSFWLPYSFIPDVEYTQMDLRSAIFTDDLMQQAWRKIRPVEIWR